MKYKKIAEARLLFHFREYLDERILDSVVNKEIKSDICAGLLDYINTSTGKYKMQAVLNIKETK
jgi:hypothetical protein